MGVHTLLVVLSLVAVVFQVDGSSKGPYQVNNQRSSGGCPSDSYLSFDTANLDVMRGSRGAPCAGYLKFASVGGVSLTSNRICSASPFLLFHKEAAKRACWTLGNNLHRNPNTGEEIMLYSCDTYMEENVEFPQPGGSAPVSAAGLGFNLGPLQGKRCITPLVPDSDCFGECYGAGHPIAYIPFGVEDNCIGIIPYWATTCSDIDECQNGVHGNCEGPFDEHCTLRPPCGYNTKCTNMPGSWTCECLNGYKYIDSSDLYDASIGCEDIDECEDVDICGKNGQCRNTNGSYFCICTSRELWDRATGKCTVAQCSSPPPLPNAYIAYPPGTSDYEDEVTYHCNPGHHVSSGLLSGIVPTFYGYSDLTSFELTCDAHGEWGPHPLPVCLPVYCGDPGVVPNAVRSGNDFRFEEEVQFDCHKGYAVKDDYDYDDSFSVTCREDGTWTNREACEDIDECSHSTSPCGYDSKRCINTVGSYFCICAAGYYHDKSNPDSCEKLEPGTLHEPCDIMESIQFCDYGTCTMDGGKASCKCDAGYEGKACDRPIISTALIIAAVALALVCFFILILIVCCIHRTCRPRFVHPPAPAFPPPVYGGVGPAYVKRPVPISGMRARHLHF